MPTILLVDDDAQILDTARDILEASDYQVLTAETGEQAMKNLQATVCDLMIVDFNLLDTTGLDLSVRVKKAHPQLPIILMTGEGHVELGNAKSAISSVLTKPVNPPDLLDLIQKTIH